MTLRRPRQKLDVFTLTLERENERQKEGDGGRGERENGETEITYAGKADLSHTKFLKSCFEKFNSQAGVYVMPESIIRNSKWP